LTKHDAEKESESEDDGFDELEDADDFEDNDDIDQTTSEQIEHLQFKIAKHKQHDNLLFYILITAVAASSAAGFIIDYFLWKKLSRKEDSSQQILYFVLNLLASKMGSNGNVNGNATVVPAGGDQAGTKVAPSNLMDVIDKDTMFSTDSQGNSRKLADASLYEMYSVKKDLFGNIIGYKKTHSYMQ
jgi:hypothetical protein